MGLPIALTFRAAFEDVFLVRGVEPEVRGKLHQPSWKNGVLHYAYEGADHIFRGPAIYFSRQPDTMDGETAQFCVKLEPRASQSIAVSLVVAECAEDAAIHPRAQYQPDPGKLQSALEDEWLEWLNQQATIESDSPILNGILERSRRGLPLLRSEIAHEQFFAAGIPWFATLFGRDSLITAQQTLALKPEIAAQTLRVLAYHQGKKVNHWKDEQQGKILHDLRVGSAQVDPHFELSREGTVAVSVERVDGPVSVELEPGTPASSSHHRSSQSGSQLNLSSPRSRKDLANALQNQ